MSELNREQIIKALECLWYEKECMGDECPLFKLGGDCAPLIAMEALSLIKELTEENQAWQKQLISTEEKSGKAYYELACEVEDLRAENDRMESVNDQWRMDYESLEAENERLSEEVADLQDELKCVKETNEHLCGEYMSAIADTVREMQERLKKHLEKPEFPWDSFTVAEEVIDQIAKEMLEGADGIQNK